MSHNTAAVHVFQRKLIEHMTNTMKIKVTKIFYVSDGCAGQYKNKKAIANLWFHEQDYKVPAEWHHSATAHGKSAVDGATHCSRLSSFYDINLHEYSCIFTM